MGLPLACSFASRGASVTVADINSAIVSLIETGRSPYDEPGLDGLIAELRGAGRLSATTDTSSAVAGSDATVVIVPAHLTPSREIDLAILKSASADVGRGLRSGALVVYETTVSMGATRNNLIPVLEQHSQMSAGTDFMVGYSPERVKANLVLERLAVTPKVVGGLNDESRRRTADLYGRFLGAPIDDVGSLEAAEMTKLVGMLYRDVNIALANELAAYCEVAGVDFERVRAAANRDGEASLLSAGIGVGGHCTPVYPYFLMRESRRLGVTQRISEAAREINDNQPIRQLERVAAAWKSLSGQRVHVLGLGFRENVKVDTLSPAYPLVQELRCQGALVTLEDPLYTEEEIRAAGFSPGNAVAASLVILNTAHDQFKTPDFGAWRRHGVEAVLDGRNAWEQAKAEECGILYFGIGRPCGVETAGVKHLPGGLTG